MERFEIVFFIELQKCVISIILYEEEDIRQSAEMEAGETG